MTTNLSPKAARFLAELEPKEIEVGDGSDERPLWVGVDPEAGRIYRIFASGLATGFGDGNLVTYSGAKGGERRDVFTAGVDATVEHNPLDLPGGQWKLVFLKLDAAQLN